MTTASFGDPAPLGPTGRFEPVDRLDIIEAIQAFMLYVDLLQWERASELLAPEVTTDYRSVLHGENGGDVTTLRREDFIERIAATLVGFECTQHHVTNVLVMGEGDVATTRSNLRCTHWIGQREWAFGGGYSHRLERLDGGWRIAFIKIDKWWELGDRVAMRAEARDRLGAGLGRS